MPTLRGTDVRSFSACRFRLPSGSAPFLRAIAFLRATAGRIRGCGSQVEFMRRLFTYA